METGPESTPQRAWQQPSPLSESAGGGYTAGPTGRPAPRPIPDGFGSDAGAPTGPLTAEGVGVEDNGADVSTHVANAGGSSPSGIRPWWAEPSGEEPANPPAASEAATATTGAPIAEGDTRFPVQLTAPTSKRGRRSRGDKRGQRHRHTRQGRVAAVAVALAAVVALVIGMVELSGGSGTATPATSGGIVLASAQTTLAAKTADLHITMAVQGAGAQITATGNGAVDFANDTSQATITYAGASPMSGIQMQEVFAGGNVFLSMPEISQLVPGKSWIVAPVTASNSISPGSTNPAAMFKMLTSEGLQVTPLGPSTIGGDAVQGYHVAISPAVLMKGVDQADLPPSVAQEVKSLFGTAGVQMSVYVGDETHLLRQITFSMHLSAASASVSVQATEDISNYGAPVSISAPPADQVLSLQQFEQAALADPGVAAQSGTA
jgi:hypothetical protein